MIRSEVGHNFHNMYTLRICTNHPPTYPSPVVYPVCNGTRMALEIYWYWTRIAYVAFACKKCSWHKNAILRPFYDVLLRDILRMQVPFTYWYRMLHSEKRRTRWKYTFELSLEKDILHSASIVASTAVERSTSHISIVTYHHPHSDLHLSKSVSLIDQDATPHAVKTTLVLANQCASNEGIEYGSARCWVWGSAIIQQKYVVLLLSWQQEESSSERWNDGCYFRNVAQGFHLQ